MKTEPMDVGEALDRGLSLPFALVRSLSRVTLGPAPEAIDLDELMEARFFDSEQEVRIFRDETGLRAVCLTAGEGDVVLDKTYRLASRQFGRGITVRQVLDFDKEDGQAYVACTCLTGWEGGN